MADGGSQLLACLPQMAADCARRQPEVPSDTRGAPQLAPDQGRDLPPYRRHLFDLPPAAGQSDRELGALAQVVGSRARMGDVRGQVDHALLPPTVDRLVLE